MPATPKVLVRRFGDAGGFPNHPELPVLIYPNAGGAAPAPDAGSLADWFETTWSRHGWRAAWRYGVYDFPHYHSTAHEILGVYRGRATLRLGDRAGETFTVQAGDVIVLPAGTAHQNLGASADFHVVGGYPAGQHADLLRGRPGERPEADARIARVPLPIADPLAGPAGPLVREWKLASGR
ncbi:MAG TPA: cupin domain-containing protein [Opitutus sp.]|nr:cupin domain-containing protein [Opitutus sp.]